MTASRLPGPPGILSGLPDALVDLNTDAGVELVQGQWRYHDAQVVDVVDTAPSLPAGFNFNSSL